MSISKSGQTGEAGIGTDVSEGLGVDPNHTRTYLSLQAQDAGRRKDPTLHAGVQYAENFLGAPVRDDSVQPSQAELIERRRRALLQEQQSPQARVADLAAGIQGQGNLDGAAGTDIATFMQNWHQQHGNAIGVSKGQIDNINAQFDQLAKPGEPHYRLSWRAAGNNVHLDMSDVNVRYQPPGDINSQKYQGQQGRQQFGADATADYQRRSFRGSLDFNIAITPEASEAIRGQAANVAQDIKTNGKLNGDLLDHAFDLAIKNRAPGDTSGKEIIQTAVTSMNNEMAGSGYSIQPVAGTDSTMGPAFADYLRKHPNAQGMLLIKDGKVVQPYAYDPSPGLRTAPEVARSADSLPDPTADRINRFGAFSDPSAGTLRTMQYNAAIERFHGQSGAPAVVDELNAQLDSAHSRYRLRIEPPSNSRKAAIYQPMQISIIDRSANGKQTDFLQLPPGS